MDGPVLDEELENYFHSLEEEEVVLQAQGGSERAMEFMLNKYKNFVRAKARSYFLIGADREDIVQEGMIGLYKSIRDFQAEKLASFRSFADLCVTRQIITAIKAATRQKHVPLNGYVSLNQPIYEEESDRTLMDIIDGRTTNPEELFISQERLNHIERKIDEMLSDFERNVLDEFMDGKSYADIAVDLGRSMKAVDNALQRIKKKLIKALEDMPK